MIGDSDHEEDLKPAAEGLEILSTDQQQPKTPVFICTFPNCGKRFKRKYARRLHEFLHQDVKPFRCEVEGCAASYSRRQHLIRHVKQNHSNPDAEFKCSREGCVTSFDTRTSLVQHMVRKHGGLTDETAVHKCDLCPLTFPHAWQLQEHLVSHGQSNPFKCEYCDEAFDWYVEYKTHLKTLHGIMLTCKNEKRMVRVPYECEYCEAQFKKQKEFIEHNRIEHPFSCQYCSKTFPNKSRLKFHGCSLQENRERFKCSEEGCTKSYLYERNLTIHVKAAHEGVKHTCEICHRKLRTKQKLQEHISKIHENPKPRPAVARPKSAKKKLLEKLIGACDTASMYGYGIPKPKPRTRATTKTMKVEVKVE